MADLSLVFDLLARDAASSVIHHIGDEAEKAGEHGSKMGELFHEGIGMIGGAILGGGIIEGFLKFNEAAEAAEKQQKVTESVVESTGGAAHVTAEQVAELSQQIGNATGRHAELVQQAENVLLTFTGVRNEVGKGNDVFTQASKAAQDMSQVLGTDSSTAAMQLGKALNDPIKGMTALQRSGVSFTQAQRDQVAAMVKAHDTLGAQKLILSEVGKEFGGAAAAAASPWEKFTNTLHNLQVKVGGEMLPVVNAFATGAMRLVDIAETRVPAAFRAATKWIEDHRTAVEIAAGIIAALFVPHLIAMGVQATITGAKVVASWVAEQAAAIAGAAVHSVQIAYMIARWIALGVASVVQGAIIAGVWTARIVASAVSGAVSFGVQVARVVGGWLLMGATAIAQGTAIAAVWTARMVASAVTGAISVGVQVATVIAGWVAMAAAAVTNAAIMAAQWFIALGPVGWIIGAVIALVAVIVANWDTVKRWTLEAWHAVVEAVQAAWNWISSAVQNAIAFVVGVAVGGWNLIKNGAETVWNWIVALVKNAIAGLVYIFENFTIPGLIMKHWNQIVAFTRAAWAAFTGLIHSAIDGAVSFVTGLPGRILGVLSGAGRWLWDVGTNMIHGLIDGAGSILKDIGKFFLNLVPDWIKGPLESALGIHSPSRVFHEYGQNIGQGLINGLAAMQAPVEAQMATLAGAATVQDLPGFAGTSSGLGYSPPAYDMGGGLAAAGSRTYHTTISGVASPEQVAAEVAQAQRTHEFLAGVGS